MKRASSAFCALLAAGLALCPLSPVQSAAPRSLPAGHVPADVRLGPLKDLDGYFPLVVPETYGNWQERAEQVRHQLLVSLGLWPMPTKTPLNPVIHGRLERDGYSVEKVYFESMPGFFVTGTLYRPGKDGAATGSEGVAATSGGPSPRKYPGVLCPHGHWADGRFHDCGEKQVRQDIVAGAERFEEGGRSPLQARCVTLARMGCVVFHWDMIGYADSQQIPSSIIHGFAKQRPEMNQPEDWGLFSPQAESHMQSAMGLQTLNSIRALDFLTSLPDVDASRIGVTGASGGGTQTFILCAIDARPTVALPAVMVSTAMQGGCTCENACGLRVGTGNIELAALFAPKPLGLTAADDWTKEMEQKGFPELKAMYQLAGVPQNVMLKPLLHFGHNYNYVSRAAMYAWFNKHLHLGLPEPIVEEDYQRLTMAEMSVWDDQHARPAGGPEFERQLLRWWTTDTATALDALLPTDAASWERYRAVVGVGVNAVIGRAPPDASRLSLDGVAEVRLDGYTRVQGLLTHRLTPREATGVARPAESAPAQEQLPMVLLRPDSWHGRTCLLVFPEGKAGLFDGDGSPTPPVRRLLAAGSAVCSADLLFQGEFLADGKPVTQTRRVGNPREAAAYTFGYNPSLFAARVHDILSVVAFLRGEQGRATELDLVGLNEAGPWAAAARAQAGSLVTRAALDTGGFRFAAARDMHAPDFLPGGAKYHDLPGMLALAAPQPLWLCGEGDTLPPPVAAAYAATGSPGAVVVHSGDSSAALDAAIDWLVK
ncbi:MAG: acetylxylan esterase [Planctomycetes bacterium]|nr:acetylxylan esterase [Planctomycetota bacterium]